MSWIPEAYGQGQLEITPLSTHQTGTMQAPGMLVSSVKFYRSLSKVHVVSSWEAQALPLSSYPEVCLDMKIYVHGTKQN